MTFNDVIIKNFTRNIGKYMSYFLSGVFCSAMFFVYSTMILMDSVGDELEEYPMIALFAVTSIIIAVFSVFFISYSHHGFVMNKKKELAVYMTVGMDEKETRKMLGAETAIIAGASIVTGMLAGCLFSRLFQIVVVKLSGVSDVEYKLSIWNFIITFIVFSLIYIGCFIKSDRELSREDISTILKEKRKREVRKYRKLDSILAVAGLVCLIFSGIFVYNVSGNAHINEKIWVVFTMVATGYGGLFMLIGFGGKAIVHFLKSRKNYYKKMLTINDIEYKYRQNVKIILMLAMLASMIVLLVGSPIALFTIAEDLAEEGSHDVEYLSYGNEDKQEIQSILAQKEIEVSESDELGLVHGSDGQLLPIMSLSVYNKRMGESLKVSKGEVYYLMITWVPGTNGVKAGDTCSFTTETDSFSLKVCEAIKGKWNYSSLLGVPTLLIVSDDDYNVIEKTSTQATVNSVTYSHGWHDTQKIIDDLRLELGNNAFINSRVERFDYLKRGYSVFMFVTCSMCFMFFISTGYVLYFKQYNDLEDDRIQYKKLYNLGIGDREIKRSISIKMAVVYFVPLLGSIMGAYVMFYMSCLFGGHEIVGTFMSKGIVGFACYSVSQLLFYILLRMRYVHDVTTC